MAREDHEMGWLIVPVVKGKKRHPRGFRVQPLLENPPLESPVEDGRIQVRVDSKGLTLEGEKLRP